MRLGYLTMYFRLLQMKFLDFSQLSILNCGQPSSSFLGHLSLSTLPPFLHFTMAPFGGLHFSSLPLVLSLALPVLPDFVARNLWTTFILPNGEGWASDVVLGRQFTSTLKVRTILGSLGSTDYKKIVKNGLKRVLTFFTWRTNARVFNCSIYELASCWFKGYRVFGGGALAFNACACIRSPWVMTLLTIQWILLAKRSAIFNHFSWYSGITSSLEFSFSYNAGCSTHRRLG